MFFLYVNASALSSLPYCLPLTLKVPLCPGPKILWHFFSNVVKMTMIHLFSSPLLLPGPHFVAVNNKNEIVVTDFHNHSVKVWRTFFIVVNLHWKYCG